MLTNDNLYRWVAIYTWGTRFFMRSFHPHLPGLLLISTLSVHPITEAQAAWPEASLQAQNLPSQPDRDRFLQPLPDLQPPALEEQPVIPVPSPDVPLSPPSEQSPPFALRQIVVTGSTILSDDEIADITRPLEEQGIVTLDDLLRAANQITQLYLNQGFITSRAVVERQTIEDGVVQIRVIEGGIETIEIEGTQRLRPTYIRQRIELGAGTPLNIHRLEDQLRLLLADPLLSNVEPRLQAGTQEGQSILTVQVTEADPFVGHVRIDNHSPPGIGSERASVNLLYRNLTRIGDELEGSYHRSFTGGSNIWSVAYRVPLNPMDGTLQLRADINRNRITQEPLDEFDIEGESELYELSYRQPLVHSTREEFALSLGFTHQDGQTFISDFLTDDSTTSVVQFGQDYIRRDVRGAWSVRSLFNMGTGLLDATNAPDSADGQFFSWLGQVQRVQRLNEDHVLIGQFDLQLSPDGLLPSQQFVIGGGQSVRGYRQNARLGDNGLRFSIEDQIALDRDAAGQPTLQVAPFLDLGVVWNTSDNPTPSPDQPFLLGTGVGVLWQPITDLNLRVDYGLPLVELRDRGNTLQDDGLYFTVNYSF